MNKDIIDEFENSLLSGIKNPDIKYSLDKAIESSVKYDYLVENFGKANVDSLVTDVLYLSDFEFFTEVKLKLEKNGDF